MIDNQVQPGHEPLDIISQTDIFQPQIMHLILLIAFIVCVVHYGLLRGTEHFVLGIIKVIALIGMIILGLLLLGLLIFSHHSVMLHH